jgi:hypothetical protein
VEGFKCIVEVVTCQGSGGGIRMMACLTMS